jgi:hypothetical protein
MNSPPADIGPGRRAPIGIGVIVPVHADAEAAQSLLTQLMALRNTPIPVEIVFVDNGGNGDLAGIMAGHDGVTCLTENQRGPGCARSAAVHWLVKKWTDQQLDLAECWIVSLDADAEIGPDFLSEWEATIMGSKAALVAVGAHLHPLRGEERPPEAVMTAARWLWDFTTRCEELIGVVNIGGCNHAVRADVCIELGAYIQPIQESADGQRSVVAGDDWDFGLRARMRGYEIARSSRPHCRTSSRRLAEDPVGFLTGRVYEGPFRPVVGNQGKTWPPHESWADIAGPATARLAAHFLLKPLVCGVALNPGAGWFLSTVIQDDVAALMKTAPRYEGDWLAFRSELMQFIFQPAAKKISMRLAAQLQGVHE